MAESILVVDDELSMRRFFEVTLSREGYSVHTAESVATGKEAIARLRFDLLLSDIRLGDGQGLELLAACKDKDPEIPVIMMTAYASPETAVEAMKLGAVDYLTKPFNVDEVKVVVRNNIRTRKLVSENRRLKDQLQAQTSASKLVYRSECMRELIEVLNRVSKMDTTILVTGESGTGKELIMRYIHENSPRAEGPFVSVNCGALPENLLESELFGYEKGAFTGAEKQRQGLFESARNGTLFLDEIGEMPLATQVRLLRVLQEKCVRRVGGTEEIPVDFRLVAATNRDLEAEVTKNNFREDLYYRIKVVPIHLPPLRQRGGDVGLLLRHFLEKYSKQCGEDLKELTEESLAALEAYGWPGNVRELENTIERIVALTPGRQIRLDHLPANIRHVSPKEPTIDIHIPAEGLDLEALLDDLRFRYMARAMDRCDGVQAQACKLLGMSFRSFRYYLSKGKGSGHLD